jgi:hypothetical protein
MTYEGILWLGRIEARIAQAHGVTLARARADGVSQEEKRDAAALAANYAVAWWLIRDLRDGRPHVAKGTAA